VNLNLNLLEMIGASLTTSVVLGEHDHRTIKTLIAKIGTASKSHRNGS
jgi:hypothetical protein